MLSSIKLAQKVTVIEPRMILCRYYASTNSADNEKIRDKATPNQYLKPTTKLLNKKLKEEQDLKKERNKLAVSSLKDIFSIFSPGGGDDEELDLSNFDPKPVYANPPSFLDLPYHKQQHIIETVNERMKKRWGGINIDVKRFVYWLSYGSHGPREGFPNFYDYIKHSNKIENNENGSLNTSNLNENSSNNAMDNLIKDTFMNTDKKSRVESTAEEIKKRETYIPIDLPFETPPILKTSNPSPTTIATKLPERDPRIFGKLRLAQYQKDKKMDPYSRFIIATLILLTILNFKRDRKVNITDSVPDYDFGEDLDQRLIRMDIKAASTNEKSNEDKKPETETENKLSHKSRRWYYLWLY